MDCEYWNNPCLVYRISFFICSLLLWWDIFHDLLSRRFFSPIKMETPTAILDRHMMQWCFQSAVKCESETFSKETSINNHITTPHISMRLMQPCVCSCSLPYDCIVYVWSPRIISFKSNALDCCTHTATEKWYICCIVRCMIRYMIL